MQYSLFRKEAIDYRRKLSQQSAVIKQSPYLIYLTYSIFAFSVVLIVLLAVGTYERTEKVKGYLVPSDGLVRIYAPNKGVMNELYVKDGDLVSKGDRLFTISTIRSSRQIRDLGEESINALKQKERYLLTQMRSERQISEKKIERKKSTIEGLIREVTQFRVRVATSKKQLLINNEASKGTQKLMGKGYLSSKEYRENIQNQLSSELSFQSLKSQLIKLENELKSTKAELAELPLELESSQAILKQKIAEIKLRDIIIQADRSYSIHAPKSGTITALQVDVGQIVEPNKITLAILPKNSNFKAELFIPTKAIGFLKVGQKVNMRYDAFPYQRFGLHQGMIANITKIIMSPSEINFNLSLNEPVYKVTVNLNSQVIRAYGEEYPLQSGMMLEADIILDTLTFFDWLFEPVYSMKRG